MLTTNAAWSDILANLHQENRSIYDINKNDFYMGIQKIVLETIQ